MLLIDFMCPEVIFMLCSMPLVKNVELLGSERGRKTHKLSNGKRPSLSGHCIVEISRTAKNSKAFN